jgi:histidinol phosphatase-like PHP family hydrolase
VTSNENQPARAVPERRSVQPSRRNFLAAGLAGLGAALVRPGPAAGKESAEASPAAGRNFPLVDFHVHLDNSTIDKVLEVSRKRGVKLGIVEHAGTKENKYPVVLSNDEELGRYLAMLEGKPVYRGVQAEWTDWSGCFSPAAAARLDYVLMDAMTFPGKDGQRVKLWESDVESRVEMADRQAFMERFVDFHVELIEKQPIDVFGNLSWLPKPLADEYEKYWTPARIRRVVKAAVEHRVALEISSSLKLPKLGFLRIAKLAGARFSFGSNGRYPNMGQLDYCLEAARKLDLTRRDMFTPAPDGRKAVQRKRLAGGTPSASAR